MLRYRPLFWLALFWILLLVILVQVFQTIGTRLAMRLDKRIKK